MTDLARIRDLLLPDTPIDPEEGRVARELRRQGMSREQIRAGRLEAVAARSRNLVEMLETDPRVKIPAMRFGLVDALKDALEDLKDEGA